MVRFLDIFLEQNQQPSLKPIILVDFYVEDRKVILTITNKWTPWMD